MAELNDCDEAIATHQLLRGAFFFGMRSCEYLEVSGPRRTKRLRLKNLRFFIGSGELPHSSHLLHLADSVTVIFEFQKTDERDEMVTMHRSGDPVLCPILGWSSVVRRLLTYIGVSPAMPVNTYQTSSGVLKQLTSKTALLRLRAAVQCIGKDILGFGPEDIGLHSLRSGAAMAMYLAGVPVYTIMLIGRWSSDAFLRYIRKQVQEFSAGVSQRMVMSRDFFTVPAESRLRLEDPRSPGNPNNFSGRGLNYGLSAQSRSQQPPLLSLHY
jgi:hypothetical protein